MQATAWFRSLYASRIGAPLGYFGATWILVSVVRAHAVIHLDTAFSGLTWAPIPA